VQLSPLHGSLTGGRAPHSASKPPPPPPPLSPVSANGLGCWLLGRHVRLLRSKQQSGRVRSPPLQSAEHAPQSCSTRQKHEAVLQGRTLGGRGAAPHSAVSVSSAPVFWFTHGTLRVSTPPLQMAVQLCHAVGRHTHGASLHVSRAGGRVSPVQSTSSTGVAVSLVATHATLRTRVPLPHRSEHALQGPASQRKGGHAVAGGWHVRVALGRGSDRHAASPVAATSDVR
jgi:hypothetical protein